MADEVKSTVIEPITPAKSLINIQLGSIAPTQNLKHTVTLTHEQVQRMVLDYLQLNTENFPKNVEVFGVAAHGSANKHGQYGGLQFTFLETVKLGRIVEKSE